MKNRQIIPDWLKGLAIVLMVFGHITPVGSLAAFQIQVHEITHTFSVPFFLIVSGFFFNSRKEPYEKCKIIVSRIVRPYLIFISLYLISLSLIQRVGISTNTRPPSSFFDFLEIIFLHPRGGYWFLHSLILIQLSLLLPNMLANRMKLDEPITFTITLLLLAMLCSYNLLLPRTALFFLVGMALLRFSGALPASIKTGLILMTFILVLTRDEIFASAFTLMQVVWALSIMAFLSGVGRLIEKTTIVSVFAWFGRNTIIVLVLHAMFINILKPLSNLVLKLDATGLLYSTSVIIITMLGCMFAAFLFDKTGATIYLFGAKTIYYGFKSNSAVAAKGSI
jgi:fucose 4-O-acetylase-like acetyltransferase